MKNRKPIALAVTLATSSLVWVAPSTANAQIDVDVPNALAAMRAADWTKAKALFDVIIKRDGAEGKAKFGGQFGVIWYNKGYTELQLARIAAKGGTEKDIEKSQALYAESKSSFEQCRQFPTDKKGENIYYFKSLLYIGQCQQAMRQFEPAITSFKKFIKDRDPQKVGKDTYPIGMFNINMAICHFRLEKPKLKEGITFYETALKNKDNPNRFYLVPNAAIVSAFKDFAAGAIKIKNETILVDFVNSNRGVLTLDPYQMYQFVPFFRKYAAEAFSVGMEEAAFTLYALIPGSVESKEDIADYEKDLLGYDRPVIRDRFFNQNAVQSVEQVRRDLEHVTKAIRKGEPHELLALRSLAFTHESQGYVRGAYNAYKSMEKYYTKTEGREDNLYNLVRTSSLVGEILETEKFGQRFLKRFPESEYKEEVNKLMLVSIFYSGEYELAHKVAQELIDDLSEKTDAHDLCLHVLSGSKFYLGQFYDAHPLLMKHANLYPKSAYKVASQYFRAANFSRIEDWANAAIYIDKFLADYPDANENVYIPFALFDRASIYFAEEKLDDAISTLDKLEKTFPSSAVEDIAFNLRGDLHRSNDEKQEASEYYVKSRDLAKRRGNDIVVEEALYKLVSLHGAKKVGKEDNPNIKDAVVYYDEFWKGHQGSPYRTQMSVAGLDALSAVGRNEEALKNVQVCISAMAKQDVAPGLEEAINTYGMHYLQSGNTADQLRAHFEDFPEVDADDTKAQALFRIAVIGVYEDVIKEIEKSEVPEDQQKVKLLRTKIQVMFKDMDAKFAKKDLSEFILLKLADFISERTGNPRKALPYYEEVLSRKSNKYRLPAQFGVANILAKSEQSAEQNSALKTLTAVFETKDLGRDKKEKALYGMIEIHGKQKDWDLVIEKAVQYNKDKYRGDNTPKVGLLLASAYEQKGERSKALGIYASLFQRYKRQWEYSIPALIKAAEFTRTDGKPVNGEAPKQIAYNMAAKFIKGSQQAYEENKIEMERDVRDSWEGLRDQVDAWAGEADIISLEQQEKNRAAGN